MLDMRVIFMDVAVGRWGLPSVKMEILSPAGELVVRVGVALLDDYLKFLAGRAGPNTVLAAGYAVVVFFRFVAKEVLTQQLRELERDGIMRRMVYDEVPARIVYSIVAAERAFLTRAVDVMCDRGFDRVERHGGTILYGSRSQPGGGNHAQ